MKIVIGIIDIALTLVIIIGSCWFGYRCINTYTEAMAFNNLTTKDKAIMYVIDHDRYSNLQNSYNTIASIPFIGETL